MVVLLPILPPRGAIVLSKKAADPNSTPTKNVPPSPVVSPASSDDRSPVLLDSPSNETTLDGGIGSPPFKFQARDEYTPSNSPMSRDLLLLGKEIQSPKSTVVSSFYSV